MRAESFPLTAEALGIPPILLGTERIGSAAEQLLRPAGWTGGSSRDGLRVLDELFAAGARGFDTAASYQMGGSERLLGEWLKQSGQRDQVFLVSKGGHPYPVVRPNRLGIADLDRDLTDSLRRLGVDTLDLYLLHRDHPNAELERIVAFFAEQGEKGRFRAWGVSNWHHDRILSLNRVAAAAGLPGPLVSSPQFSLAEWSSPPWKGCVSIAGAAERQAREFYARSAMPVLAWSALGRGFFSGSQGQQSAYAHPTNEAKRARVEILAKQRGMDVVSVALAYVASQDFPVHPVVAVSSAEHFSKNLAATRHRLSPDERAFLETGEGIRTR